MESRDRRLLIGGFAVILVLLRPWREFSLLDDWAYAYTVKTFMDTGRIRISDWSSPTLVLQAAWGLLFCFKGFSFAALRLSTVVLSLASVALAHRWFSRLGLGRGSAALAASALAVNPVFLNMSLSFMTDVPFLFTCLVFFNLVTRDEEDVSAWLCGLTAAAAALIRQPGVLLPIGYAAYLLGRRALGAKRALALLVPPFLALGAYEYWFTAVHGVTWAHYWYNTIGTLGRLLHPAAMVKDVPARIGWCVLYGGLASLPLAPGGWDRRGGRWGIIAAAALYPVSLFPDSEATVNRLGLGRWFALGRDLKAPGFWGHPWLWKAVALAGVASAFVSLTRLSRLDRRALPTACAAAPLFLWLFIGMEFYDRYLLMLLPLMLLPGAAGARGGSSWAVCAVLAAFSVAGEADYLNCHAAFWRAARSLEARGYPADSICATSEYVLWHGYQADMDRMKRGRRLFEIDDSDWVALAAQRRRAIVSFADAPARPGFVKTGEEEYFSPLALRRERLAEYERQ